MTWDAWIILGVCLLVAELVTPGGFYLFFFGFGALVVGLIVGMGLSLGWLQWLCFPIISLILVFSLRSKIVALTTPTGAKDDLDDLIDKAATCTGNIGTNAYGKVELRGTSWNAKNVGPEELISGERCKVIKTEGLTLEVIKD